MYKIKKLVPLFVVIFVSVYYIMTSGFIYEVTKNDEVNKVDVPFSVAFSNDRIGFVGIYNDDDIACAEWLTYKSDLNLPILVDYLSVSAIIEIDGYNRITYVKPEAKHYLFLNTWNIENNKWVNGWVEASRQYSDLPDLTNYAEVFKSGKAVVYIEN